MKKIIKFGKSKPLFLAILSVVTIMFLLFGTGLAKEKSAAELNSLQDSTTSGVAASSLENNQKSPVPSDNNPASTKPRIYKKDVLLLKFKPGVSRAKMKNTYNRFGVSEVKNINDVVHVIKVQEHALEKIQFALSHNPVVEFVEKDYLMEQNIASNDPRTGTQYHVSLMHYPEAWNISTGISDVIVAAPDSGILSSHEDLKNVLLMDLALNTVDHTNNTEPTHYHGTATAGCIGADTNNNIGIASAPWHKKIIPLKISNQDSGSAYISDMVEAINYAADNGAKVVSISYGGAGSSSIKSAAAYLNQKGGLYFMSAGNSGQYEAYQGYGGNWPETIIVAATTVADRRALFSSYGEYVDISAPGSSVHTTNAYGGYGYYSGTSFSSPVAASVAALLFSAYPNANHVEVEQALLAGVTDLGTVGYDVYYGHGRVDAYGAMSAMESMIPDTTPPTVSINSPADGAKINSDTTILVGASDLYGISKVELYINGQLYNTDYSGENEVYSFYWDLTNYENGPYDLTAKAFDTSDNTNTDLVSVTVEKDTNEPAIQIIYPVDGSTMLEKFIQVTTETSENTIQVDFYIKGDYKATDTAAPFTYKFNSQPYDSQTISIKTVAFSSTGLSAENTSIVTIGGSDDDESETRTQCNDNKDNDRDGGCDFDGCYIGGGPNRAWYDKDEQCINSADTSEAN